MKKNQKNQILIYADMGADEVCVQETLSSLKLALSSSYLIKTVDRHFLNDNDWEKSTYLIVVPGGRSLPYYRALRKANKKIIEFVNAGGNYLGICAGGYYGSAKTLFEKGNNFEVICDGVLNFFPGVAEGSAYGLGRFNYQNYSGAQIAKINTFNNEIYSVYYNGGCFFVNAEKYNNVKILAHYADIENNPTAIIQCKVGKGTAILSGVHVEYSFHALEKVKDKVENIYEALKLAENSRQEFFKSLLQKL